MIAAAAARWRLARGRPLRQTSSERIDVCSAWRSACTLWALGGCGCCDDSLALGARAVSSAIAVMTARCSTEWGVIAAAAAR